MQNKQTKNRKHKTNMKTINCTPNWQGLLPVMIDILQQDASPESIRLIKLEFQRMAQAADSWNAFIKNESIKNESQTPKTEKP